jgi:phage terminase large subunit-like protein
MSDIQKTVEEYMAGVMSGNIIACKWVKLAVKRQMTDQKKPPKYEREDKSIGHYHFDQARAEHVINFIHLFCIHVKGVLNKKPLILAPWQQFVTWVIFGWVDDEDRRRFNTVFIEVAKKNGKSTWVAALGLYMGFIDGEGGAEIYSAATTKDQAKVVFHDYARAMVVKSPELKKYIRAYSSSLVDVETETNTFRALASDVDQLDGKNVHCAIIDEYHAHKTDGVYKIMSDGMSARAQPMTIIITTAGFDPEVPCVDEEEYAQRVLSRKAKNETYFGIIFTLDKDDEWFDKSKWPKANPCLGVSKMQKAMDRDFQKALDLPSEQSKFKNKNLNIWTKTQFGWIKGEDWEAVEVDFDMAEMEGREAYAAIDLATTIDSYTLAFPWEDKTRFFTRVFLPEEGIEEREKQERFEWQRMADEGYCVLTCLRPGARPIMILFKYSLRRIGSGSI